MNLRQRLAALEKQLTGSGITRACSTWGGPSPTAPSLILANGEQPDTCSNCGLAVNESGKTVAMLYPNGTVQVDIIILDTRTPRQSWKLSAR